MNPWSRWTTRNIASRYRSHASFGIGVKDNYLDSEPAEQAFGYIEDEIGADVIRLRAL